MLPATGRNSFVRKGCTGSFESLHIVQGRGTLEADTKRHCVAEWFGSAVQASGEAWAMDVWYLNSTHVEMGVLHSCDSDTKTMRAVAGLSVNPLGNYV